MVPQRWLTLMALQPQISWSCNTSVSTETVRNERVQAMNKIKKLVCLQVSEHPWITSSDFACNTNRHKTKKKQHNLRQKITHNHIHRNEAPEKSPATRVRLKRYTTWKKASSSARDQQGRWTRTEAVICSMTALQSGSRTDRLREAKPSPSVQNLSAPEDMCVCCLRFPIFWKKQYCKAQLSSADWRQHKKPALCKPTATHLLALLPAVH